MAESPVEPGVEQSGRRDHARHLLAEGVVADPADVDACLILGAGWPLFLGGAVTRQPLRT